MDRLVEHAELQQHWIGGRPFADRRLEETDAAEMVEKPDHSRNVVRMVDALESCAARLHEHRSTHAAGVAEHAQVTLDLGRQTGRLFRIVGKLDSRMSVDRRYLAD